jgi:hypothetical protein
MCIKMMRRSRLKISTLSLLFFSTLFFITPQTITITHSHSESHSHADHSHHTHRGHYHHAPQDNINDSSPSRTDHDDNSAHTHFLSPSVISASPFIFSFSLFWKPLEYRQKSPAQVKHSTYLSWFNSRAPPLSII